MNGVLNCISWLANHKEVLLLLLLFSFFSSLSLLVCATLCLLVSGCLELDVCMQALVDYNMSKTSECLNGAATLRKNEFPAAIEEKKKRESLSFRFTVKKKKGSKRRKGKKGRREMRGGGYSVAFHWWTEDYKRTVSTTMERQT